MTKSFKEFSNEVKQLGLNKDDLIRQLYMALSTQQGIPWVKYDPENPPDHDVPFIIYSGESEYLTFGEMILVNGRNRWVEAANSSAMVPHDITHYAPINLPIQD